MAGERPLTVLQVLPALAGGGVERGTLEVAAALARAGHRSLVMSAGGRLVAELEAAGSEHLDWPIGRKSLRTLALIGPLRRLLAERRVDILHARSRLPAWIAWLAWRGMAPGSRPRLVTTVHGFYSVSRYSAVMTRGERVIAVSEAVRAYLLRHYPRLDPERIVVIPRGVDRAAYPYGYRPSGEWLAGWHRELPAAAGRVLLTLPGRLSPLKGHEDLIELLASLGAQGIRAVGLAVGDPRRPGDRYPERLRAAAEARGVELVMLPHRGDLREIMASSDVVLSLSRQPESFGRTVLEALSLGVPVAGYAHGGVGEILAARFPAGRVPPGDRQALAATVTRFLEERPVVPRGTGFGLEQMLGATLALYRELVNDR